MSGAKANAGLQLLNCSPDNFPTELLATQCRQAKAYAAAILRPGVEGQTEVLAVYPQPDKSDAALDWISSVENPLRKVLKTRETVIIRDAGAFRDNGGSGRYLIMIPLIRDGTVHCAAAFRIREKNHQKLLLTRTRLETTPLLLSQHELQSTVSMYFQRMNRLRCVVEVLDAVNRPSRFLEAAMVLCNEIAAWVGCDRVCLGILEGSSVKVRAMSHMDSIRREMQVIQAIEETMEECLDQDVEVTHPAGEEAVVASRAAARLSQRHGPSAVLSIPLRKSGNVAAVLTLERSFEHSFERLEEIEAIRLICDLCTPRMLDLHRNDQWVGARLMSKARHSLGRLLGHEHTWIKLSAALIFSVIIALMTVKGEYRINANFTLKAQHQQVVVAPFDTYTKSILVEPGDRVEAQKSVLGNLETAELRLQLAALKAELLGYQKQMTSSMRDRKTAQAQIAILQSDKVAAQMRIIEEKIKLAKLIAPISGWVVSEDRKQQIGAPVEAGEKLFEIASIDSLRAELHIPESSISRIYEGQTGTLAAVGHPDQKVPFSIDRINPIAEVVDHQNVFRVRARINKQLDWMRPGMVGEARISAGKKSYFWIASHRIVDWVRMKLWI